MNKHLLNKPGDWKKHLHEVRNFSDDLESAEGRFLADVGVRRLQEFLDFRREISRHFDGSDGAEGAEGEADNELGRAVQVVLQAVGHQQVDLLPFVQKQHRSQVPVGRNITF